MRGCGLRSLASLAGRCAEMLGPLHGRGYAAILCGPFGLLGMFCRWGLVAALSITGPGVASTRVNAEPHVSMFNLANGMQVVVIPDHRVAVVTHMVWYRAGSADDPWGTSGIAHFLEHLMFKSTNKMKSGEFTRIITGLGGRDNAQTNHDTTFYFSAWPSSICVGSWR